MDGPVLLFTGGISILAGLLFGVFPVLRNRVASLTSVLREQGRGGTSGRERQRARATLVTAQIALALVLTIGAGPMGRSFFNLKNVDPGFQPEGVLTFTLSLPPSRYPDADAAVEFHHSLLDRLASIPGVDAVGASSSRSDQINTRTPFLAEGTVVEEGKLAPIHLKAWVTEDHFQSVGIPLLAGRTFTRGDAESSSDAAIISQSLADRYWPNDSALGRRFRQGAADTIPWHTVVGVVGVERGVGVRDGVGCDRGPCSPPSGHGWHLRRHLVRGQSEDARDRGTYGSRSRGRRCPRDGCPPGDGSCRGRVAAGGCRSRGDDPRPHHDSLRGRRSRYTDLPQRRGRTRRRHATGELPACPSRDSCGSDHRASAGLIARKAPPACAAFPGGGTRRRSVRQLLGAPAGLVESTVRIAS